MKPAIATVLALQVVATAAGCGKKAPVAPTAEPAVRIEIAASQDLNGGRPLQILFRAVAPEAFLQESYDQISQLVFKPDQSVINSITVLPGSRDALRLVLPTEGQLAVYALFTDPQLTDPNRPWRESFELGDVHEMRIVVRKDHLVFNPGHAAKSDLMPLTRD